MLSSQTTEQPCPCGTGQPFAFCCKPFIEGQKTAPTARLLMRSRYTAFVLGAIDYLIDTTAPEKRDLIDPAIIAEQVQCTNWLGLDVIHTQAGEAGDQTGVVEFKATFETSGETHILHEISRFTQPDNRWLYLDGDVHILPAN